MSKPVENSTIVAGCPDRGTGNDQEALVFVFYHQGTTFIIALATVAPGDVILPSSVDIDW